MRYNKLTGSFSLLSIIQFLNIFIKEQKIAFGIQFVLCLAWSSKEVLFAYYVKCLVNFCQHAKVVNTSILFAASGLITVWLIMEIAMRFQGRIAITSFPRLRSQVREHFYESIQKKAYAFFDKNNHGNITNKILDASKAAENLVEIGLIHIPSIGGAIIIALVLLTSVNYYFALLYLIWFILHLGTSIYFTKKCHRYSVRHAESYANLSGKLSDALVNIHNAFLFTPLKERKSFIIDAQNYEVQRYKQARWSIEKVKTYQSIYASIYITAMVCLLIYGWQHTSVTLGDLALVPILSFNLIGMISWFSYQVSLAFKDLGTLSASLKLLTPVEQAASTNHVTSNNNIGEIILENISFAYADNNSIFDNISMHIKPNEKVALIGPSGVGKSTLVKLLIGLYPLKQGQIFINDEPLINLGPGEISQHITVVPQDVTLFNTTILENLRLANRQASEQQIIEAAKVAGCDGFIKQLEKKYYSLVGEGGIILSGGQRQRLGIARALLKDSPILVFDEASSALDYDLEITIFQNILKLMSHKTILFISHRESILPFVDRVFYLNTDGKIRMMDNFSHHRNKTNDSCANT